MGDEERTLNAAPGPDPKDENPSAEAGSAEARLKALEEELKNLKAQLEDKHDKHLRAVAELSNYRKRVQKEREELMRLSREDLVLKLVDVLDNFDRALVAAKTMSDFDAFHKGVELILKQMSQTLQREGLVAFDSKGQAFDPTMHDAVMVVETDKHPPGIVVDEINRGYRLGERVVRPAIVTVSKEKGKAELAPEGEAPPAEIKAERPEENEDDEEALSTE
jgi:molecular chaperone GrpE